jgi:hypothetical protein
MGNHSLGYEPARRGMDSNALQLGTAAEVIGSRSMVGDAVGDLRACPIVAFSAVPATS